MTPEQPTQKKGMSVWVVVLIVGCVALFGCCIIGTLAGIAVPNFMRYTSRAKQAECKARLKAAYVGEMSFSAEKDRFSEDPRELGLVASDGARSVLVFGPTAPPFGNAPVPGELAEMARVRIPQGLGVQGKCPDCTVTIGCASNIDGDKEIDVWSISTAARTGARGEPVPAGQPYHDFDDLTDSPGGE
ncbi:MAG: hypothetical protein IPJ65_16160 [Archangiaceae bacterium]|nr:hypothetical protein [Archangiaceae bacterium]